MSSAISIKLGCIKMQKLEFTILGNPLALQRPRFSTKSCRVYDPSKLDKQAFGWEVLMKYAKRVLLTGPITLDILFFFPIPKNKKREEWDGRPMIGRPDLSNCIKFVEDACEDILYKNDCTIWRSHNEKLYGFVPRTEFTITQDDWIKHDRRIKSEK